MNGSPALLDLSFMPGQARSWARVMVVRPSRDHDDAVTLSSTAGTIEEFERTLDRLRDDIEIIRHKARDAFARADDPAFARSAA